MEQKKGVHICVLLFLCLVLCISFTQCLQETDYEFYISLLEYKSCQTGFEETDESDSVDRSLGCDKMQYRYEQIAEILEGKIRKEEWKIGHKLPGELELAREYHVGRSTIRETLNILQQKGMVEKRFGSGTYVKANKQKMENPLLSLSSIGKMIESAGYEVKSVFYGIAHETPDELIAGKLNLKKGEKIVVMNRERTANGVPVVYSYNVFPEKLVGNIFDNGLGGSIFQLLEEKCNTKISYADTLLKGLSGNNAWDEQAMVYLGEPIVLLEQLHFDQKENPILFSFDYIRTDIVNLHIRRKM